MESIVSTGSQSLFGLPAVDHVLFSLGLAGLLVGVALAVLLIVAYWKVLVKAGYPGWGSFIPVYNVYLMFKLAGRPANWTWWILFPPVLAVLGIIAQFDIAKRFGKNVGYGFGLWLLPIIFYPLIAFGDAKYQNK